MTTINLEDIQSGPVKTEDNQLTIEMPDARLPVGSHRFALTVQDDSGNESARVVISLIVVDQERPTAVLDVRDANGRPLDNNRIPFGRSFILDARRSSDAGGGRIVSFTWELQ